MVCVTPKKVPVHVKHCGMLHAAVYVCGGMLSAGSCV